MSNLDDLYQQYLGRAPDPSGISTWSGQDEASIIAGITGSQEYANLGGGGVYGGNGAGTGVATLLGGGGGGGQDINQIYQQYLGRDVDPSGAQTYAGWAPQDIIGAIQGSQEYANLGGGGGGLTPTSIGGDNFGGGQDINALYQQYLGRDADVGGAANWAGKSTDEILAGITGSQEYQTLHPGAPIFGSSSNDLSADYAQAMGQISGLQRNEDGKVFVGDENSGQWLDPNEYIAQKTGLQVTNFLKDRGNINSNTAYYTDPNTGNVYNASGQLALSGQAAKDPELSAAWENPEETQRLYNLKQSNPNQYYDQVASDIAENAYANYKQNANYDDLYNRLQSIKDVNPAAYYKAQLDFLSRQAGWQEGQNTSDKAAPVIAQIQQLAPAAQAVGVSSEEINNIVNSGFSNANVENQQRIITEQLAGHGSLGMTTQDYITIAAILASGAGAAYFGPAMAAAEGAAAGAGTAGAAAAAESTIPAWLTAAGEGALKGAAMGGINAGISGGNVGQGILRGGLTGAVGGGLGSAAGGGFTGNVLGGIGAGAAGAGISGGNIGRGALMGGAAGALNYGTSQIPGLQSTPGQFGVGDVVRGALTGGALSSIQGGDFGKGAVGGATSAYLNSLVSPYVNSAYNKYAGGDAGDTINPATGASWRSTGSGYAGDGGYEPLSSIDTQTDSRVSSPYLQKTDFDLGNSWGGEDFGGIGTLNYKPGDVVEVNNMPGHSLTLNDDGSFTATTPTESVVLSPEDGNKVLAATINHNYANPTVDYSQGDVYLSDSKTSAPIPSSVDELSTYRFPDMSSPSLTTPGTPSWADYMQNAASVTVTHAPDDYLNAYSQPTQSQDLSSINDEDLASMAKEMSQPSDSQDAVAISESAVVEANATTDEQETIDALKDIITSPYTAAEEKQAAAEELKNMSVSIASRSGVESGQIEGVLGGDKEGVVGGALSGTGVQPGTGGGLWGEEGNPGEDKIDMIAALEQELGDETAAQDAPIEEELAAEEAPTEEATSRAKAALPKTALPTIKKLVSQTRVPGYSWNEKVNGALPGNLESTFLAAAPVLQGPNMNINQLKQLYPQLSTIDPRLLQTLMGKASATSAMGETGAGGTTGLSMAGQGGTPQAGYPSIAADRSSGSTKFASESPLSGKFSALSAAGLDALGGSKNAYGLKDGGHIPQFKTGTTGHYVQGEGDGQSDDIPAMLADGEYVFDADTVAALGNGSNKAGALQLDRMRQEIRKHKRSAHHNKIPPKAKSPLEYMKGK